MLKYIPGLAKAAYQCQLEEVENTQLILIKVKK